MGEAGYWLINRLRDMDVVFAASLGSSLECVELQAPAFIISVSGGLVENALVLTFMNMAAAELATFRVEKPGATTWASIRPPISECVAKPGFRPVFVLPNGSTISASDDARSVAELFACIS